MLVLVLGGNVKYYVNETFKNAYIKWAANYAALMFLTILF